MEIKQDKIRVIVSRLLKLSKRNWSIKAIKFLLKQNFNENILSFGFQQHSFKSSALNQLIEQFFSFLFHSCYYTIYTDEKYLLIQLTHQINWLLQEKQKAPRFILKIKRFLKILPDFLTKRTICKQTLVQIKEEILWKIIRNCCTYKLTVNLWRE